MTSFVFAFERSQEIELNAQQLIKEIKTINEEVSHNLKYDRKQFNRYIEARVGKLSNNEIEFSAEVKERHKTVEEMKANLGQF